MKFKLTVFVGVFFVVAFALLSTNIFAQSGSLDTTFDSDGIVTTHLGVSALGNSMVLQTDGKIVVAGIVEFLSLGNDIIVLRYNTNGSLDTTFDTDGIVTTDLGSNNDLCNSVALQPDGKIVAAGSYSNGANIDFAVLRYNTNGSLDTTFNTDGIVTTTITNSNAHGYSVVLQNDGKIVLAGNKYQIGSDFAIVRYNTNGSLDTTFDADGIVITDIGNVDESIYSIALQDDDKIVAAGYSGISTNTNLTVARYNTDGSLDTTFNNDGIVITTAIGNSKGASVVVQADDKIVVGGYGGTAYDFVLVRYNANGSLDTTFNVDGITTTAMGNGFDICISVAIQNDSKIIAGGASLDGSDAFFALARYNTNGDLDTTFDADGKVVTAVLTSPDDQISTVAIQNDGKIVAAGINGFIGLCDIAVVRYNNTITIDIADPVTEELVLSAYPNPAGEVITVKVNPGSTIKNYTIIDQAGRVLLKGKLNAETTSINIHTLLPGMYFFLIENHRAFKFIKE